MNNIVQPQIIGLTGGIASGKSTVARLLERHGCSVIDADLLGHRVLLPGHSGFREVVEAFGDGILDTHGRISRFKLGMLVFKDPAKLEKLNSISHPYIASMIEKEARKLAEVKQASLVFLEAALLIEAGWLVHCQSIWVVTADRERVLKRIAKRNSFDVEEAEKRIEAQIPPEERLAYANVVLYNNGTVKQLETEVEMYLKQLKVPILNGQ